MTDFLERAHDAADALRGNATYHTEAYALVAVADQLNRLCDLVAELLANRPTPDA
jgi:hypothetical protein